MNKNLIIILLSILVLGCNSDDDNSKMVNIESTLIAKDALSGNGGEGILEQNLVITDQNAWNDLIFKMNSVNNESDNFAETDIDFSEYIVIAVFDEIRESGGYSLELNITSNSENIIVNVIDITPEGNNTTVMIQPYHIVKISTSELPIIFE